MEQTFFIIDSIDETALRMQVIMDASSVNNSSDETAGLLREIRDLLRIVAGAHRREYNRAVVEALGKRAESLQDLVKVDKQWEALKLMDGERTQIAIAREVGIDQAGLSRFTKRAEQGGFVVNENGKRRATLSPIEIDAVRDGGK